MKKLFILMFIFSFNFCFGQKVKIFDDKKMFSFYEKAFENGIPLKMYRIYDNNNNNKMISTKPKSCEYGVYFYCEDEEYRPLSVMIDLYGCYYAYACKDLINKIITTKEEQEKERIKKIKEKDDEKKEIAKTIYDNITFGYRIGSCSGFGGYFTFYRIGLGLYSFFPKTKYNSSIYYNTINPNELSDDHVQEYKHQPLYNLGFILGYLPLKWLFVGAEFGYTRYLTIMDCYDNHHILGNNGHYQKGYDGKCEFNYGITVMTTPIQNRWVGLNIGIGYNNSIKNGVYGSIGLTVNLVPYTFWVGKY